MSGLLPPGTACRAGCRGVARNDQKEAPSLRGAERRKNLGEARLRIPASAPQQPQVGRIEDDLDRLRCGPQAGAASILQRRPHGLAGGEGEVEMQVLAEISNRGDA